MSRKIKKVISVLVIATLFVMSFAGISLSYVSAAADVTAPIVDVSTLRVSQKTATAGDTVKVSVKVTDETEINSVRISYRRPKTNNNTLVWLDYNAATGYYDGDIKIEENSEDGLWKIDYIYVSDKFYNSRQINNTNVSSYGENTDLSIADFEVMGTVADITAPIVDVSTLGVSQKTATAGDTVKVSVKVTDETEINSVRISYRRLKTNNNILVWLDYNATTGYYDGDIKIEENSEDGLWEIDYIYVSDKFYNSRQINNTNVNSYGENADLSIADFEVVEDNRYNTISPLENVTVYTSNTTVSNKTINGDVYIGPEAVVTLSNVTVTGNIYVLGGLRASSINAVSLYARYMSFSYITSYRHGEVSISGSNSFTGTTSFASNYCPEVPIRIDEAINKDGKLYIKGATAQIADMYILGTKININNNGRFVFEGIDVQDAEYITIQWVMYDGSKQERKVVLSDENGNIPLIDINISESEMTIKEGESVTLTTTCYPDNTTFSKKITWSSSDTNVATVDANGTVIAKSAGTAVITATTENGKTASCTVTVEKKLIPITEVCLDKSSATLPEGETTALTATVLPENTTDSKNVSWSSSNSEVAIVDANGTVTAKSAGTAIITATSENGKTASCAITVEKKLIPITEVSLSESAVGIIEGNTHKLTATVLPENTTDSKSVSWSSNNEAVATVSEDGTITAKSAGTAVITATSTNGKTAGCTVTVSKKEIPIVDVALNRTSATITEGDILNLTATVLPENTTESKNIGWSSSNNDIATVDSTGKVTAKQAGTVVITATSSNGKTASCTITVEKKEIPITEVVLNKTSAAVDEGETIKLIATVYPENTTNGKSIKWNSNNNTVVTVDLMGNVTAKKAGTAIITATSENGVSASCTITVNKRDTYTGLRDVNGELTYFNNGNVDTTYTGLVDYEDSTYYVRNGVVDITYTGFADYEDDRYYISEGVVDTEYTGLVQDGDDWLYVENGKVNSDYTGLTYYNDVWFYITNGKINWGYTGLVYYNDIWFYVSGGMIDWNYAGLVYYNDVWFYVSGGMIGWDYTGLAYFADTWFYISNGMLDWNYLGLTYYNDMWFVISGGTINWSYMGLVYYNDIWFYVSGGTINWDYEGLIYYRDTWFYVSGGCVDWTTAVIEYKGNKFYIQDGMVDWNFSGTIDYKGYTYHIVGGMVV